MFNATDYLVDRHLREGRGTRTAVVSSTRTLNYQDLALEVHRVAGGLQKLGVRREDRVMLCMVDDVELLTGILATMYLGAIAIPVSTMLSGPELGKLVADAHVRIVCASTEFAAAIAMATTMAPDVADVVFDDKPEIGGFARATVHHWDSLTSADPVVTACDTYDDTPALWLYTSGTTGMPKAAIHRHGSIRSVAESYGAQLLGIAPQDRCLSVAKLFFAYGLGNSCFFPLSVGAATVLQRVRPTPAVIAQCIQAERPTLFFAVPTFFSSLLASDLPNDTFVSVRQAVSAGEALTPVLFNRFRDRFGVEVLDGVGSTEALHIFLSNRPGEARAGSAGVPVPGYQVQLRDEAGAVIDTVGARGILHVKGASIASGYWNRADATRQVFSDGWLRTGDAVMRNADGTYSWLGRSSDMLKAGGIWVSPAEVEERLLQHPDVVEAAVVGAADESGLEKPVACVVPRPGRNADAESLGAWCREGLAAFKRPRAFVMMAELPKTATAKLRRDLLREQVADVLTRPPATQP
ncbi:benzoate--CoA ligase [Mycobacterium montefiorense]|uniref:Benzoate--CoA ligase n=1 Tax=Mycobacterium montefiorense TaxID=154654 RepID=A0AA37PKT0_9MYCO|nr:benzoate--CoA ligase [Mycobacterium montefiorense]GKU33614.1 benzoate--CoA ligase [Mycobacterium montefiorense]GKU39551.1 benzoate--CoA ligase [Mycobacterium montefiorense]GKU43828.1 benzoate--CoA ligase [Mycobacterium montefiorense]GKU52680.1 benzoate--CoA ligase [Mycobacterium montefiorense]